MSSNPNGEKSHGHDKGTKNSRLSCRLHACLLYGRDRVTQGQRDKVSCGTNGTQLSFAFSLYHFVPLSLCHLPKASAAFQESD
jgi:hypothetical protein